MPETTTLTHVCTILTTVFKVNLSWRVAASICLLCTCCKADKFNSKSEW